MWFELYKIHYITGIMIIIISVIINTGFSAAFGDNTLATGCFEYTFLRFYLTLETILISILIIYRSL